MAPRTISLDELTTAQRSAPDTAPNVYKVDARTVVKTARRQYLFQKVTALYLDETSKHGFIVMEYIDGVVLRDVWDDMDTEQKDKMFRNCKASWQNCGHSKAILWALLTEVIARISSLPMIWKRMDLMRADRHSIKA
ncbi:MAG: hypothetical protein M1830_000142 [Pleopsidium flavum]|nr:MAG: hypothetical protein M1830_000142 [Pleopsidium flavum]